MEPRPTTKIQAIILKKNAPNDVVRSIAYNQNETGDITIRPQFFDRLKALDYATRSPNYNVNATKEEQLETVKKVCTFFNSRTMLDIWLRGLEVVKIAEVGVSRYLILAQVHMLL
jgi:hypothetical protein